MFKILYDNDKTLCFVSRSMMSLDAYAMASEERLSEIVSIEDLSDKDQTWFDQRQFAVFTSDVKFKQNVVALLESNNAHFFTMIENTSVYSKKTKIGYGNFIGGFNSFTFGDITIGNHCVMGDYNKFSHSCVVNDFCHISHYIRLNRCELEEGCVIGSNAFVDALMEKEKIIIAPYTNILAQSRVTTSITTSGTYYGLRKINSNNSLQERFV